MKCVVVGAGPVGSLAALYAAKRGWDVEVYELRGDLRDESTVPLNFTRSINLALSERGINAIKQSGSTALLEYILSETVPMYGRMIHGQDTHGNLVESSQQYDIHGRPILAIDRGELNKLLLDELERLPNVKLVFYHKVTGVDFRRRKAWFEQRTAPPDNERVDEHEVDFDLMLGCDGAHSRIRYHMMKFVRMSYSQSYIDTLWCEFTIKQASDESPGTTPSAKDGFATSPNHLHIWPGKDDMFIAIPSIDKTFTCTLFAPSETFADLEASPNKIEPFFHKHFPGAADLIGGSELRRQFKDNPHLPLVSVKCTPHHYKASGVVLGDAAHAMVPFYGQGMNAGLEDVFVLFQHLDALPSDATTSDRAAALDAYTKLRVPDAHTINDLALYNYSEMKTGVTSPLYRLRKRIEEFLSDKFPASGFATQYSRVSFSNQRYSEVATAVARQKQILVSAFAGSAALPIVTWAGWWAWRWYYASGATKGAALFGERLGRVFGKWFGS